MQLKSTLITDACAEPAQHTIPTAATAKTSNIRFADMTHSPFSANPSAEPGPAPGSGFRTCLQQKGAAAAPCGSPAPKLHEEYTTDFGKVKWGGGVGG
jgi:hypothetical protein